MNTSMLMAEIHKPVFSRQDIYTSAFTLQPGFKETQMRNLMGDLLNGNRIVRVGRNQYRKADDSGNTDKKKYKNLYSQEALGLIKSLNEQFPYLRCCVWELSWLNEFLNHLAARNCIFVETENDGCEFVYSFLARETPGTVLMKPSDKELAYYCGDHCIIVDRLISEAPGGESAENSVPIEKIIVDLFANHSLKMMISKGDYPNMLENIFERYTVEQTKMFRYARRRNRHQELAKFIRENTSIKLLVEV